MKNYSWTISKLMVIAITFIFLNMIVFPNYQYATAADLSSDNLRPEINRYWNYRNSDLVEGWIFEYKLKVNEEKSIKVANQDVPVLVLEGEGIIEGWPSGVSPGSNYFYIKKDIIKSNLEMVTYTQQINYTLNYHKTFITYNITEFNKPVNITIGSKWMKKMIITQTIEYKRDDDDKPVITTHPPELINSTFECDKIVQTIVPAGTFDTFRIVERQWIDDIADKTIFWYYSIAIKGFVKMEKKNAESILIETEELLSFGVETPDNGNNHVDNNDTSEDDDWLDITNTNTQLMLGMTGLAIICIIIGVFVYKKKH
jgi:hypothetical protein